MNDTTMARDVAYVPAHGVSLREAFWVWLRVAALSFGGPAGQIAVMHRILVEEKRWISEERFLHALNYCMLLPGPEAQQLATYIGWLMHRTLGGIMAGGLFIVPGVISIMALSYVYAGWGNVPIVAALFFGLKAAVLAIVIEAVVRIGKRSLKNQALIGLAAAAFIGIFFFDVPFPIIVFGAALIGFIAQTMGVTLFQGGGGHGPGKKGGEAVVDSLLGDQLPDHARPTVARALKSSSVWLALWLIPVVALLATFGGDNVFSQIAIFFSKMAMVTFGGAYAVLAYVAQQAVENYHWLKPGEMLDGLGMAETTPGPLIMVLQFVGFMAAFRDPGGLSPMLAGTLGGLLATWVTFTPCFLWIFLGAPFVEQLRGNKSVNAALSALTAAVVGVISEPRHLVRHPHCLPPDRARAGLPTLVRCARSYQRRRVGAGALGRGGHRYLPLQGGNDPDAGGLLRRRRCPLSRGSTRMMHTQAGAPMMSYKMKPLGCDPQHVKGMSEKLIVSHYENNYGGAVKRLNLITEQLADLDFNTAPGFVINGLKREELIASNSMILHELFFDGLGDESAPGKDLAAVIVRDFGSIERWKSEFIAMGKALGGGSGWVLLSWSPRDNKLVNQWAADHCHTLAGGQPIVALDMYEHSYHIDYGAKAATYVDTFMNAIRWSNADRLFASLTSMR